jgi:hypothetical protein
MSHSTHIGFRLPPTWAASVGVFRVASDGAFVFLALWAVGVGHRFLRAIVSSVGLMAAPGEALRLVPALLAVGVGSDNPDAVPLVGGSGVIRSQHTPPRIVPERGKVTEDSGKASSHKHR